MISEIHYYTETEFYWWTVVEFRASGWTAIVAWYGTVEDGINEYW
jgi:hypothetical protein